MFLEKVEKSAPEIFTIERDANLSYPFDLRFRKIPNTNRLPGPGVYFIRYDGQTIYIGKYQAIDPRADVFSTRIQKHLQTLTLRGHQVGFGRRNPQNVLEAITHDDLESALSEDTGDGNLLTHRLRDTGTVTSSNRIRFASQHWDRFGPHETDTDSLLGKFTIHYFPLDRNRVPYGYHKQVVTGLEKRCIQKVKPVCNGQSDFDTISDDSYSNPDAVIKIFKSDIEDLARSFWDGSNEAVPGAPAPEETVEPETDITVSTLIDRKGTRSLLDSLSDLTNHLHDQFLTVIDWTNLTYHPDFYETDTNQELVRAGIKDLSAERAETTLFCVRETADSLELVKTHEGEEHRLQIEKTWGRTEVIRNLDKWDKTLFRKTEAANQLGNRRPEDQRWPNQYSQD